MSNFESTLHTYKQKIDADIEKYAQVFIAQTQETFGEYPTEAVKAYARFLTRGGKRIRGVLTMHSYYMFGGTNDAVALQAARAIEMLHAYILAVDDIQDRSVIRRGGPTVHIDLKHYHQDNQLKGESHHFGESIAMNAFLFGVHSALDVLANLEIGDSLKLNAIRNVNKHFIGTAHGQTLDIFNEVSKEVTEQDVDNVLLWKTASYTFANPLQLGAILAGASESNIQELEAFSMHAGRVFQITDDIIGVFGDDEETGKNAKDDIIEGKRTILTVYALKHVDETEKSLLERSLGNLELLDDDFTRCREIIKQCGALTHAREQASSSAKEAIRILESSMFDIADKDKQFLRDLVQYMLSRTM